MRTWDPESAAEIETAFNHWDDIEVLVQRHADMRTTGHGFVGIGRKQLLNILQKALRCGSASNWRSTSEVDPRSRISRRRSRRRFRRPQFENPRPLPDVFKPDLVVRPNRYIWLGTKKRYDAFTFDFRRTEHGWFQAHIYRFDAETSTFIVETTEEAFKAHGLGELDQDRLDRLLREAVRRNARRPPLMSNARHLRGSAWLNFSRLICGKWSPFNGKNYVVLMGDAAHTAHFAIGSGTKLAIDDAIELARQFDDASAMRPTNSAGSRRL